MPEFQSQYIPKHVDPLLKAVHDFSDQSHLNRTSIYTINMMYGLDRICLELYFCMNKRVTSMGS